MIGHQFGNWPSLALGGSFEQHIAHGWVNFDGTAGTLSPRDSENVLSLTDNGAGDYTVTWTEPFSAATYAVGLSHVPTAGGRMTFSSQTAGAIRVLTGSGVDSTVVSVVAFGAL